MPNRRRPGHRRCSSCSCRSHGRQGGWPSARSRGGGGDDGRACGVEAPTTARAGGTTVGSSLATRDPTLALTPSSRWTPPLGVCTSPARAPPTGLFALVLLVLVAPPVVKTPSAALDGPRDSGSAEVKVEVQAGMTEVAEAGVLEAAEVEEWKK